MTDERVPDPVSLPCGCLLECAIIDGERTMILTACSEGELCKWARYVMAETRVHGNRLVHVGGGSAVVTSPKGDQQ